jgi:hypothetical protein
MKKRINLNMPFLKCNNMKWALILIMISVMIIGGCASKKCVQDSDCKSANGCAAGCWNVNSKVRESGIGCPRLAGPENCICHQNQCQDASEVVRSESVRNFENAFSLCKEYGEGKPKFVYHCFDMLCSSSYAIGRNITSGRSQQEICEEKMEEAQAYLEEYFKSI